MRSYIDISGMRFGRLEVIEEAIIDNKIRWKCRCDCGNITYVRGAELKRGRTKSCGCYMRERTRLPKKHGMTGTKIYYSYQGMLSRCKYPSNIGYHQYGGRGIKVCDEWANSFEAFYDWSMKNGYSEDLSIDRIDVNGNYEPSNCRWATRKTQMNNKTNSRYLTYNGETHTMAEWSDITGICYGTLKSRINYLHWNIEDALTKPIRNLSKKGRIDNE